MMQVKEKEKEKNRKKSEKKRLKQQAKKRQRINKRMERAVTFLAALICVVFSVMEVLEEKGYKDIKSVIADRERIFGK